MQGLQALILIAVVTASCLARHAGFVPSHSISKRQSSSELEALTKNLKPVGNLIKTQHKVQGTVYKLNSTVLLIENFVYDGKGFGVHVNIATEGDSIQDFVANRRIIGYPDPDDVDKPIEDEYKKEDKKWLVVRLPKGVKSSNIKWLSLWCEIFNLSFGHVLFD